MLFLGSRKTKREFMCYVLINSVSELSLEKPTDDCNEKKTNIKSKKPNNECFPNEKHI